MQASVIRLDQLTFVKVNEASGYDTPQIMAYDGIIIDSKDSAFAQNCVLSIRRHHLPELYLKPIFLSSFHPSGYIHLHTLTDGVFLSDTDAEMVITKTKRIFQKSLDLHTSYPPNAYGAAIKKAMDFMYCRENRTLQPHLDPFSIIGYSYPEMSVSFDTHEEAQILDALEWAEKQDIIWPDFLERIYVCNQCSGGFLSYREVCPHCQSSHTKGEDLIHHFPCAYIGPLSDFTNDKNDDLNCPKCDKGLHHIGVDYDKPSVLYHCNNCDTKFQDLYVKAKCLSCKNDVEVQYLQSRDINTYKLTNKGRHAITQGFENLSNAISEVNHDNWLSEETFMSLIHLDVKRSKQDGNNIALIGFEIKNHKDFEKLLGGYKYKKFIEEIYAIVQGELNDLEYAYVDHGRRFWFTKYQKEEENLTTWKDEFCQRIEKLIQHNYQSFPAKISSSLNFMSAHPSGKECYRTANHQLSEQ